MVFEINVLTVLVMALLGGLCAYLANQNIAVFNDGIRPVYPQHFAGMMDRKSLFATSFALSFGLVVGFGVPTSLAGGIIIVHTIMLACDIIGAAFPDQGNSKWISAGVGAVFGVALLFIMQGIIDLFALMPINFLGNLDKVGSLITMTFCVFPALVVAYQCSLKAAFIVFGLTLVTRQAVAMYGTFTVGETTIALNVDGMALLVSIIAMVVCAMIYSKKREGKASAAFAGFEANIVRIKKNIIILSVTGGVVALATTLCLIAEGPGSLAATAAGNYSEAAIIALGRAVGFIPLVMTTAVVSGLYSPAGTKLLHVPAILFINMGIWGAVGSFFTGCVIMAAEVLLLGFIAKGLDTFPGMKDLGDNVRSAMGKILDLALLLGGCLAANAIAPTIGYVWIFGLYFLNQVSKKPVPTMAIGPLGAILLGVVVNILYVIGLFPAPVA